MRHVQPQATGDSAPTTTATTESPTELQYINMQHANNLLFGRTTPKSSEETTSSSSCNNNNNNINSKQLLQTTSRTSRPSAAGKVVLAAIVHHDTNCFSESGEEFQLEQDSSRWRKTKTMPNTSEKLKRATIDNNNSSQQTNATHDDKGSSSSRSITSKLSKLFTKKKEKKKELQQEEGLIDEMQKNVAAALTTDEDEKIDGCYHPDDGDEHPSIPLKQHPFKLKNFKSGFGGGGFNKEEEEEEGGFESHPSCSSCSLDRLRRRRQNQHQPQSQRQHREFGSSSNNNQTNDLSANVDVDAEQQQQQQPMIEFKFDLIVDEAAKPASAAAAAAADNSTTATLTGHQQSMMNCKLNDSVNELVESFVLDSNDVCLMSTGKQRIANLNDDHHFVDEKEEEEVDEFNYLNQLVAHTLAYSFQLLKQTATNEVELKRPNSSSPESASLLSGDLNVIGGATTTTTATTNQSTNNYSIELNATLFLSGCKANQESKFHYMHTDLTTGQQVPMTLSPSFSINDLLLGLVEAEPNHQLDNKSEQQQQQQSQQPTSIDCANLEDALVVFEEVKKILKQVIKNYNREEIRAKKLLIFGLKLKRRINGGVFSNRMCLIDFDPKFIELHSIFESIFNGQALAYLKRHKLYLQSLELQQQSTTTVAAEETATKLPLLSSAAPLSTTTTTAAYCCSTTSSSRGISKEESEHHHQVASSSSLYKTNKLIEAEWLLYKQLSSALIRTLIIVHVHKLSLPPVQQQQQQRYSPLSPPLVANLSGCEEGGGFELNDNAAAAAAGSRCRQDNRLKNDSSSSYEHWHQILSDNFISLKFARSIQRASAIRLKRRKRHLKSHLASTNSSIASNICSPTTTTTTHEILGSPMRFRQLNSASVTAAATTSRNVFGSSAATTTNYASTINSRKASMDLNLALARHRHRHRHRSQYHYHQHSSSGSGSSYHNTNHNRHHDRNLSSVHNNNNNMRGRTSNNNNKNYYYSTSDSNSIHSSRTTVEDDTDNISDICSVIAEPPKQLKLEEFLGQLSSIIAQIAPQTTTPPTTNSLPVVQSISSPKTTTTTTTKLIDGSVKIASRLSKDPPLNGQPTSSASSEAGDTTQFTNISDGFNRDKDDDEDDCKSHSSILEHLSSLALESNSKLSSRQLCLESKC